MNDLYNQLKSHENEVNEIAEEAVASLGGPLALVSKVTERESEKLKSDEEEGFLMNSDDEAVAFYSNNRVKKFFKKPFNPKKSSDSKSEMEQMKMMLKGDTGINCHYCYGANHLAVDCLLRKKEEKKNKTKDEAYYTEKLEEVKLKAKNLSLVAHGETESEGISNMVFGFR